MDSKQGERKGKESGERGKLSHEVLVSKSCTDLNLYSI